MPENMVFWKANKNKIKKNQPDFLYSWVNL